MVGAALRRRREFLRYRQLLCRRRVGDDAGRGAEGQAAGRRHRLQGLQSDGRPAERFGHVAAAHQAAGRGQPAPPADRLHRRLLHPSRRHPDAARGDAARLRRSRAPGQDPLHRLLELRGVAPDGGAVAQRHATAGRASTATSRNTAWWCATSTRRSCRPARPRGWASSPGRRSPAAISPASTSRAASRRRARARPKAGASTAASSRPTTPRSCRRCSTPRARSTARRRRPRCAG